MAYSGMDPLRIPAEFWQRDDVMEALRENSFKRLFLLSRIHHDASQTKIATACGLTQGYVSRIMTGKHQPRAQDLIERIATGYQMPDHARRLLGLAPRTTEAVLALVPATTPTHLTASRHVQPRTLLEHLIRERNQSYEEVAAELRISPRHVARLARRERDTDSTDLLPATRRALHRTFGYTADELLRQWSASNPARPSPQSTSDAPTETDSTNLHGDSETDAELTSTLDTATETEWAHVLRVLKAPAALAALPRAAFGPPDQQEGPLDPQMVSSFLDIGGHYRRAYHAVPASRLLPAAIAHLDLVLSFRPAARRDNERTPLITAAGEMAALAGVLLGLDASRHDQALSYFDFAWNAARSVDDVDLQSVVLASRSFVLAYGGANNRAGLEYADLARTVAATGACPQTRAWVAAVASERSASLGDLAGSQRRLDESRSALSSVDCADVPWRGIGGYDADKLRAYEGGNMLRLGRFRAAETLLDDALSRLHPTMSRHRATALLDRAEARLGLGEADAAYDDATRALGLVIHVQHTGHLDRIEALTARGGATKPSAARTLYREVQLARVDNGLPIREAGA